MSYDIVVFDANAAPKNELEFMIWWDQQMAWHEDHDYQDPKVTTKELKGFYKEMITQFPPLNGPDQIDIDKWEEEHDEPLTDYSIGENFIMMSFGWSQVEQANEAALKASINNHVGFWDISTTPIIYFPNEDGDLVPMNADGKNGKNNEYPKVYKAGLGWMLFVFLFTLSALIALIYAYYSNSIDLFSLNPSLIFIGVVVILILATWDMYKWKLTIYEDGTLETSRPFFKRQLHISEIARQSTDENYIHLIPKDSTKKKLRVSQYVANKEELLDWLEENSGTIINEGYRELDKQVEEHDKEMEKIFSDDDYGHSEEERIKRLDLARTVSKWSNRIAIAICLWAFFYPYPLSLSLVSLAILPFIGIAIKLYFKGLIRLDNEKDDALVEPVYPSVTSTIMYPSLVFPLKYLLSQTYNTTNNYWTVFSLIVGALSLLYILASRKELKGSGLWLLLYIPMIVIVFGAFSYGFVGTFNSTFDTSIIEVESSIVKSKKIRESSKGPDDYLLEVIPGKELTEHEQLGVSIEFYEQIEVGDTVFIGWQKGALNIPWYYILEIDDVKFPDSIPPQGNGQ